MLEGGGGQAGGRRGGDINKGSRKIDEICFFLKQRLGTNNLEQMEQIFASECTYSEGK